MPSTTQLVTYVKNLKKWQILVAVLLAIGIALLIRKMITSEKGIWGGLGSLTNDTADWFGSWMHGLSFESVTGYFGEAYDEMVSWDWTFWD